MKWALGGSTITLIISLAVTYISPRRLTFISRMILWTVISTCLLLCSSVDIITVSSTVLKEREREYERERENERIRVRT